MVDTALGEKILDAVSAEAGVPKAELPSLYGSIEGDCLEGLVAHAADRPAADVTVQFAYAGYTVTVSDSQRVAVEE